MEKNNRIAIILLDVENNLGYYYLFLLDENSTNQ